MRIRTGQIVRVQFLDHVQDGHKPMEFAVYGQIGHIDKQSIRIDCWCHAEKDHAHDLNVTSFTLLRSTILKITHLQEVKDGKAK